MPSRCKTPQTRRVALLAEGVDRNASRVSVCTMAQVALLAEGVDRNILFAQTIALMKCRPPRGGRG